MAKPPRIPPTHDARQVQLQIPAVELGGVGISVGPYQRDPTLKAIIVGPLFLAIPLSADAAREVVRGLTGVIVPGNGDIPQQ